MSNPAFTFDHIHIKMFVEEARWRTRFGWA